MTKRLFVGKLPYSVTDSKLEEIFAAIGTVSSANVINDRDTGQSKGFGFVDMENDKDADKAIAELNDSEIEGRNIVVNVAKPREERSQGPRRF